MVMTTDIYAQNDQQSVCHMTGMILLLLRDLLWSVLGFEPNKYGIPIDAVPS